MGQILAGVNISVEQFFGGQISFVDYLLQHNFLGFRANQEKRTLANTSIDKL